MKPETHLMMAVLQRDEYRCVRCNTPIEGNRGVDWSLHHRRPRGMGGTRRISTAANFLSLCGSGTTGCHGHVESHRSEALAKGWLLLQTDDPERVAVLVDHASRWLYLTADGRYADGPPERAA